MKKSIFTFLIFILLMSMISSCYTSKKSGCDCPGTTNMTIEIKNENI